MLQFSQLLQLFALLIALVLIILYFKEIFQNKPLINEAFFRLLIFLFWSASFTVPNKSGYCDERLLLIAAFISFISLSYRNNKNKVDAA